VASKRHHLRFFPKENDFVAGDRNGNCLPGTLVERDCVHPFEWDFCEQLCTRLDCTEADEILDLSSHSAIQGTARPTHYHVILDEFGVKPNLFQVCF
jgi:eukaryotic translation initiation factor 2C